MYNNENLMTFTLDQDGVITSKTLRNKDTWYECLQEFLYFLEGAGFTDVRKRVAIDAGVFTADDLGWYGATFDAEESEVPINTEAAALSGDTPRVYKDDWIDWDAQLEGEELPYGLTPNTYVNYKLRSGSILERISNNLDWSHSGGGSDIIAYKVI